jgi:spermidine synthase
MTGGGRTGQVTPVRSLLLYHGTTVHGTQVMHPDFKLEPTTYYHRTGPIGHVFRAYENTPTVQEVGVVGLGVGSLAAYGEPGRRFSFYEIDPAVVRIARDQFTFLRDSRGEVKTLVGDGRLLVAAEPDGKFGLLVIDGFSSDSIPVHLLTREAVALYLRKLRPDGLLALHVTSAYFDLLPVAAEIAASLGVTGLSWADADVSAQQALTGKLTSYWVVIAPNAATLAPLRADTHWHPLAEARRGGGNDALLWTDNHSSPLRALKYW